METTVKNPVVISDMKKKIRDIQMAISWRELSREYHGNYEKEKSPSN